MLKQGSFEEIVPIMTTEKDCENGGGQLATVSAQGNNVQEREDYGLGDGVELEFDNDMDFADD